MNVTRSPDIGPPVVGVRRPACWAGGHDHYFGAIGGVPDASRSGIVRWASGAAASHGMMGRAIDRATYGLVAWSREALTECGTWLAGSLMRSFHVLRQER